MCGSVVSPGMAQSAVVQHQAAGFVDNTHGKPSHVADFLATTIRVATSEVYRDANLEKLKSVVTLSKFLEF